METTVKLRKVDGTCYAFDYDQPKYYNYRQAQSKCKTQFGNGVKGTLFEPRSQQTMDKVFGMATEFWNSGVMYDSHKYTVIGVKYDPIDEKFKYVSDGKPIMIAPWGLNSPREYAMWGNNTCVSASWFSKNWWDVQCHESTSYRYVICELQKKGKYVQKILKIELEF